MTGNIQGITIELRGKTTPLEQALRKVTNEVKSVDKELRNVDKALKLDPKNVDLWRAKQDLLNNKIKSTEDKLKALKDGLSAMDAKGVDHASEDYRSLQRQIAVTETELKSFNAELKKVGNANLKALSEQFKQIGGKMASVGKSMTTALTMPIVAGYTAAANLASDYEENLNKIDVAFGKSSQTVKDWASTANVQFGLSKVQATDAASAFGALGKGIGLTEKDAAGMSTTLAGLSADLGSYFNVGIDESSKALEGIFTGESEALKKFGVVMTDTNLKQFAADQGLVWGEMSQTEKTMLRYNYVMEKTKDAQGDFARTSDGTANSTKVFKASVQDLGTSIGTVLLPIITPIIQKITEWINKFNELSPATQKVITIIGLVVAVLGPVIAILGTLISSIGAIAGSIGLLAGPVGIVIAIFAGLVAAGVLLYKNWGTIKKKAVDLKNNIVKTFNAVKSKVGAIWKGIKEKITKPIGDAVKKVKSGIDKIKKIINKAKLKLPKFKVPHFKINGGKLPWGIGGKGYAPSINVDWYAEGGIFDSASLIGVGEKGSEAVLPLDTFWKKMDKIAEGANSAPIVINVYGSQGMNVNELAAAVERRLVLMQKQREAAWT